MLLKSDAARTIVSLSNKISIDNYKRFLDIINMDQISDRDDEIASAVNIFLDRYFVRSHIVFYAFTYRSGSGDKGLYAKAYDKLYPFVVQHFDLNVDTHLNYKAMNFLSYLIVNYHGRILKDIDKAKLKAAMKGVSIAGHRRIFSIFRRRMLPKEVFDYFFDLSSEEVSVQYLFCLFLIAVGLDVIDCNASLEFIKSRLSSAKSETPGDDIRRSILCNYTGGNATIKTRRNIEQINQIRIGARRRVALLVSGQLRNCSFASRFAREYLQSNYEVDVFVTTWNVRGAPPPILDSLRGYASGLRTLIKRVAVKHNVSAKEFAEKYHRSFGETITYDQVKKMFRANWCEVDVEGVSTQAFESNQSRMFFKLAKVFEAARHAGQYDCFVRMRPDLSFGFEKQEIISAIEGCFSLPKIIYLRQFSMMCDSQTPLIDDNFAVASPQAMEIYASLWARRESNLPGLPLKEGGNEIVPHSSLAYWLMMNSVQIEFLAPVSEWKFNEIAPIDGPTYIDYLKELVGGRGINEAFVFELVSVLTGKVEASAPRTPMSAP